MTGLPLYYLDMLWHKPDKSCVSREEFDLKLGEILTKDEWILDGNFQRTFEERLKRCDTVFLMDYPLEVCIEGVESRIGKPREDMPWIEQEFDPEFKEWIMNFGKDVLPRMYEILKKYPDKKVIVFRSRNDADEFLKGLEYEYFKSCTSSDCAHGELDGES